MNKQSEQFLTPTPEQEQKLDEKNKNQEIKKE